MPEPRTQNRRNKRLKRLYKDEREQIFKHDKHEYSVVNLRIAPKIGADEIDYVLLTHFEEVMDKFMKYPYEVADTTNVYPLIIGKFQSGEEAIEFLREYCESGIYKLRDELEVEDGE